MKLAYLFFLIDFNSKFVMQKLVRVSVFVDGYRLIFKIHDEVDDSFSSGGQPDIHDQQ